MKKNFNVIKLIPYLFVTFIIVALFASSMQSGATKFAANEFRSKADKMTFGDVNVNVGSVMLSVNGVYVEEGKNIQFSVSLPKTETNIVYLDNVLNENGANKVTSVDGTQRNFLLDLVSSLLPIVLMLGLGFFLITKMNAGQGSKAMDFAKSRAKIEGDIKIRFTDVAGCVEEKEEVKEIIDYLRNPKKFSDMGARIPKGMLLVGPPGTGKTLLAKAVAGEADVPFFSISGSDFVEMFVGTGAGRVRDMFKKANQTAPCIVFIDEIDAVGRKRGAGIGGGNDEREQTLNQLLVEMDGIGENKGIIIIAATNRADVLDPALLRSGRFDRQITVDLPDKEGRAEILAVHGVNKKFSKDVSLENIAKRTPGFSGADLENVLNEGAILAVRNEQTEIHMVDLEEAIDRVMGGPAKVSKKYSEKEKLRVAFHEAGHTIIGLKLEGAYVVEKVTIVPRGKSGGYNLMTPKEENYFETKAGLLSRIVGSMGGRAAEELMFGDVSNGATGDIQSASEVARNMVKLYGMSELGPILLDNRYSEDQSTYSQDLGKKIDDEVRKIINEGLDRARIVLKENKPLLELIANTLLEKETLTSEEIINLEKYGQLTDPNAFVEAAYSHKDETVETSETVEEVVNENKEEKLEEVVTEVEAKEEDIKEENKDETKTENNEDVADAEFEVKETKKNK